MQCLPETGKTAIRRGVGRRAPDRERTPHAAEPECGGSVTVANPEGPVNKPANIENAPRPAVLRSGHCSGRIVFGCIGSVVAKLREIVTPRVLRKCPGRPKR